MQDICLSEKKIFAEVVKKFVVLFSSLGFILSKSSTKGKEVAVDG